MRVRVVGIIAAELLGALLVLTCALPILQAPARLLTAPPMRWRVVWAEVEECTGRTGNVNEWQWWLVEPGPFKALGHADWLAGLTVPKERRIYLAANGAHDERLVRHEVIHALGVAGHPPALFARCSGT